MSEQAAVETKLAEAQSRAPSPVFMIAPEMPASIPISDIVSSKLGRGILNRYGEENLSAACSNQEELVRVILEELKSAEEFARACEPIVVSLEKCKEGKPMCEHVKRLPGEEASCPPDIAILTEACMKRKLASLLERRAEDERRLPLECERDWEYNKKDILYGCEDRKKAAELQCNEELFVADCIKHRSPCKEFAITKDFAENCAKQNGRVDRVMNPQGCVVDVKCLVTSPAPSPVPSPSAVVSPSPSPSPSATPNASSSPVPVVSPNATASPTPSPTQLPNETVSPTPSPTTQANLSKRTSITGFATGTGQPTPEQQCREKWAQNRDNYARYCEQLRTNPHMACDTGDYIKRCVAKRNEQREKEYVEVDMRRICEIEVKMNMVQFERFCSDAERGYEKCLKNSDEACKSVERQLETCREMMSGANVEKAVREVVSNTCKFKPVREQVKVRPIELNEVPPAEVILVVVAVPEQFSGEDEARLRAAVESVEGYYVVGGMRIYSARVRANGFEALKSLNFVKDVKIDHVSRAIETKRMDRLDKTIEVLEASRELVSSDFQPWFEHEQSNLLDAKKEINELNQPKNLVYMVLQFLGMQAQQERADAAKLKAQTAKLLGTVDSMGKLAQQVSDISVQAALLAQMKELREQAVQITQLADEKERNSIGFLSLITNLFRGSYVTSAQKTAGPMPVESYGRT